ncbi:MULTISPECIES: hypothetical protein [Helicobacter]|uniref:Uncharacterized protein n=1 Tax=Helicobacter typhlonius TaxID=76936 RepID=A0A0S4PTW7_9HELI|nr:MULTISPECIES: hypothetical protein [Helicobacter]CUU39468.1 Hypothetical protein BN2458_PEG0582 [Helicobacter typhlonius]
MRFVALVPHANRSLYFIIHRILLAPTTFFATQSTSQNCVIESKKL